MINSNPLTVTVWAASESPINCGTVAPAAIGAAFDTLISATLESLKIAVYPYVLFPLLKLIVFGTMVLVLPPVKFNTDGDTFKHEVCHGLYYIDSKYKATADAVTALISETHYNTFEKNLLKMGYTESIIKDEIQAYLQYGWETDGFGKGVPLEIREMYNNWYEEELNEYSK